MTLLEKIDAYVASQGNQVGGGSEFANLLKEIVNSIPQGGNEPLIVEGTIGGGGTNFMPKEGAPSFDEAMAAFLSGRPVFAIYTGGAGDTKSMFTMIAGGGTEFYFSDENGSIVIWEKPL